jgi:16S rRNA (uracil1498-N3)-methyltransferase
MARFFLPRENLQAGRGVIDGRELEHLRRVLRLGPGDQITVFGDDGREHEAVIRSLSAQRGEIEILRSYEANRESPLAVTLALGLTKGEKMDFVIEKATELGVQTILPFRSSHAVPKFDAAKVAKRAERWRNIVLSAAKQCGRTRTPEVLPLCEFAALLNRSEALKLMFWEKEKRRSLRELHAQQSSVASLLLAVGPEGGFSAEEADWARAGGFETVHLGRRILRAETAALAVVSLVQFLWGDLSEHLPLS